MRAQFSFLGEGGAMGGIKKSVASSKEAKPFAITLCVEFWCLKVCLVKRLNPLPSLYVLSFGA